VYFSYYSQFIYISSIVTDNGQASPTAKNDAANLLLLNLSLKKSENSKFIETLLLLGACNG